MNVENVESDALGVFIEKAIALSFTQDLTLVLIFELEVGVASSGTSIVSHSQEMYP